MNITTSVVKGNGWTAYALKVYHIGGRHFCLFNKETYELEYEDGHLIEKEKVDTAELILTLNKVRNVADLALEQIEEILKDKIE